MPFFISAFLQLRASLTKDSVHYPRSVSVVSSNRSENKATGQIASRRVSAVITRCSPHVARISAQRSAAGGGGGVSSRNKCRPQPYTQCSIRRHVALSARQAFLISTAGRAGAAARITSRGHLLAESRHLRAAHCHLSGRFRAVRRPVGPHVGPTSWPHRQRRP